MSECHIDNNNLSASLECYRNWQNELTSQVDEFCDKRLNIFNEEDCNLFRGLSDSLGDIIKRLESAQRTQEDRKALNEIR